MKWCLLCPVQVRCSRDGRPWVGTAGRWCDCRLGLAAQADFEGLALPKHALQAPKRCTALLGHSCFWLNNGCRLGGCRPAAAARRHSTLHCPTQTRACSALRGDQRWQAGFSAPDRRRGRPARCGATARTPAPCSSAAAGDQSTTRWHSKWTATRYGSGKSASLCGALGEAHRVADLGHEQ